MTTASGAAAPVVFRLPRSAWLLSLFAAIVIGAVSLFLAGFAVFAFIHSWSLGLFMTAVACFTAGLTGYVSRDLSGKWGLQITLGADAVTLDLPAGRSLIHRPPAQHLTVPYADIAALETRLEAYGSLGMKMMQRAYVLRRWSGGSIFLFEERALATGIASSYFAGVASELSARAGLPWRDLGMVEGRGGLLGVWGTEAPDWAAPPLPFARQMRLWRHAALTGTLAFALVLLGLVLRALTAAF